MTMLEGHQLGKRYRDRWALRNCSFSIPDGSVAALVGPNGAGKTTLLNMSVGLIRPSVGDLRVAGGLMPGSPEALSAVAYVAQEMPLPGRLSVADTLALARCWAAQWDQQDALHRLTAAKIPLSQRVDTLSGGQRSQVALAVALARHPELLILDEPLARLDPVARQDFLFGMMDAVAERGMSVIFSSHVLAELSDVCDFLVVLNDGCVQLLGSTDNLLAQHTMLIGPADEAAEVSAILPTVRCFPGAKQTRLLVRAPQEATDRAISPAWRTSPVTLEELVLDYLRSPASASLPGPTRSAMQVNIR